MVKLRHLSRVALGAAALMYAAACGDSTGPVLNDPAQLTADLQAIDATFFSPPAVQNFGALGGFMTPTAAGTAARAGAIVLKALRASVPADLAAGRLAPAQVEVLRQVVPALAPASPAGPVIPNALYGRVYTWNTTTDVYEFTASNGPADGVRFILYQVDVGTGFPVEPLVPVGSVDFRDQSTPSSNIVRIQVFGTGTTPPEYVNYTISLTQTTNGFTAQTAGFITDAAPSNAKRLEFSVTISESSTTAETVASIAATIAINNPSLSMQLSLTIRVTSSSETLEVNFSITHGGQTVSLSGSVVSTASGETVDLTVRVNGRVFARAQGDGNTAEFRKPNGDALTQQEEGAVFVVLFAPISVLGSLEELFLPGEALFP